MRKVTVPIYQFKELAPEVQEELLVREFALWDLSDEINPFLNDLLVKMKLPQLSVSHSSILHQENDQITLQGIIESPVDLLDKSHPELSRVVHRISVQPEENPGVHISFNSTVDKESEAVKLTYHITNQELAKLQETLVMAAQQFLRQRQEELRGEISQTLQKAEYFADGTVYQDQ
jgi:hypothetical protein